MGTQIRGTPVLGRLDCWFEVETWKNLLAQQSADLRDSKAEQDHNGTKGAEQRAVGKWWNAAVPMVKPK